MEDYGKYAKDYDEAGFWKKIGKVFLRLGRAAVERMLAMYYCMRDSDTPYWAKAVIVGALGYFISPLDAIPDFLPGVGYTDDIGVLAVAMVTVEAYLKKEHWERALRTLNSIFGGAMGEDDDAIGVMAPPPGTKIPCPKCGSDNTELKRCLGTYIVKCRDCGAETPIVF